MKIDFIIKRFRNNYYDVKRCASGKLCVEQPNGFFRLFDSYHQEYRYYFGS